MRIGSQNTEMIHRSSATTTATPTITSVEMTVKDSKDVVIQKVQAKNQASVKAHEDGKEAISKEQLEKAVTTMNDFLEVQHKASKFVFHEGLDKYYVKLVDSKTEEVIKEIPPERLLDAFYEMQKLTGMIVDEKI